MKQTRFYQQAFAEGEQKGKLLAVSTILAAGLTMDDVRKIAQQPEKAKM